MAKNVTISVSVSADGFTWTPADEGKAIDVFKGDTIDFQPSGPTPPTSMNVTLKKKASPAAALFGITAPPVPSQQTVQADDGVFLTAGVHTATVRVSSGGRPVTPDPGGTPSDHTKPGSTQRS